MIFDYKIMFAILAIILTIAGYAPYIRGMVMGTNKPHIFTWVVWVIVAGVAFFAQLHEHAGPGAWVTGFISFMCLLVSLLALKLGTRDVTRSDIIMFLTALSAIPVWMLTKDPLWSVIIVTVINSIAFYPTVRKSWQRPYEEHVTIYALNIPRQMLAIAALTHYSVTTVLFPASVIVMCILFFGTVTYRRRVIDRRAQVTDG